MRIASFYPYGCDWVALTHDWHRVVIEASAGVRISTTQMVALDLVKHYDEICICDCNGDSVVQIHNNHDGTYDCPQTERTLRFANRFYNLWANNEFGDQPQRLPFQDWRMHDES